MAAPTWNPATLYEPGAVVVPRTIPPAVAPPGGTIPIAPINPEFDEGMTGWVPQPAPPDTPSVWEVSADSELARSGNFLMWSGDAVDYSSGGYKHISCLHDQAFSAPVGQSADLRIWLRCTRESPDYLASARVYIVCFSQEGERRGTIGGWGLTALASDMDTGWVEHRDWFTIPEGSVYAKLLLVAYGGPGSRVMFDSLSWNGTDPASVVPPPSSSPVIEIPNSSFETGDLTNWVEDSGSWYVSNERRAFDGTYMAVCRSEGDCFLRSAEIREVTPGESITVSCYLDPSRGSDRGSVAIFWFDEVGAPLMGSLKVTTHPFDKQVRGTGGWRESKLTTTVPALAKKAAIGAFAKKYSGSYFGADKFSWTVSLPPPLKGLMYRAVQPALGLSAGTEPAWPGQLGLQVIDNEVIWEAVSISRIVYEARPLLRSGLVEPEWPVSDGGSVADGTISWLASSSRITDPNCPNTKEVVIAASKVFAGDRDVVRYSATLSPTDWSTPKDAGYLPTGMNQNGANHVSGLNIYRGNLIVLNATGFQQWQIDPDPAMMDLLDEMSGVGSRHHLAAQPVANDLFYLANIGVRTLGISGATNNLRAGDIGMPVDVLVQERMSAMLPGEVPLGTYYPSAGQYWLIFNKLADAEDIELCPTLQPGERHAEAFVYVLSQSGQVGAWSRFVFPFAIDDVTHQGDDLFVRDGDTVLRLSEEIGACDLYEDAGGGDGGGPSGHPFWAEMQTHWLDMGQPGREKSLDSFDLIGYGKAEIAFAYAQESPDVITGPIEVDPDTLRGDTVPIPLTAPSLSVRIRYSGWDPNDPDTDINRYWGFNALGIYMR